MSDRRRGRGSRRYSPDGRFNSKVGLLTNLKRRVGGYNSICDNAVLDAKLLYRASLSRL